MIFISRFIDNVLYRYRRAFFNEFGGLECNTQIDQEGVGRSDNPDDNRICLFPSDDMKKKASASYIMCYSKFQDFYNFFLMKNA